MRHWPVACVTYLLFMLLALQVAYAGPCVVSGPRYQLVGETIGWSMSVVSGQNCSRGLRFKDVIIENVKLAAPPQSGQLALHGPGFSYTAKSDFQGEDRFTVIVSGAINRKSGISTIEVSVSVTSAPSRPTVLAPVGRLPGTANNAPASALSQLSTRSHPEGREWTWRPLRIGAGGWLTGMTISSDGSTRAVRTDTYGAYIWNASRSEWTQLVTASSMPATEIGVDKSAGVFEICVAPNLSTRLYMAYHGRILRSDDSGSQWIATNFTKVPMEPNDSFRMWGQKMAVDPANPNVVYVGTQMSGMFVTNDGGATWRSVRSIPESAPASNGQHPGITGIVFDPNSGTTDGRTNVIYAASYGRGVFRSANAGASWSALTSGPTSVSHGKIAAAGAYYVVGNDGSSVWRYFSSVWTDITPIKNLWSTVIADPFDSRRVVAVRVGGYLDISLDRGATWSGIIWGPDHRNYRVATDVPWLAWTNETFMSDGDLLFDPVVPDRLWFAEGIGVWYTDVPKTSTPPTSITFTSQSAGIEQLVANQVIAPPGGKPVLASGDRPAFYVDDPDVFPSTHGPDNEQAIVMGWALDYASTDPTFIAGLFNWWGVEKSAYSTNGGRTWTSFATYPPTIINGKLGGSIAASSPANIIWVPSNNASPYYTKDGGMTWAPITFFGVGAIGETGWGRTFDLRRHIVAADRVAAGTFYIYNYLTGLSRSTDGGATWTLVYPGHIAPWSGMHATLQSVPGHAGHLFFTSGPQGNPGDAHPAPNPFMRSMDGGKTWTAIPDVLEVRAFGFGANVSDYPAIFIAGWVNRTYGIWQSDDNGQSWTKIGVFPLGSLDKVTTIDGDKNRRGKVYIGFSGSGYAYGVESTAAGECEHDC